SAIVTLPKLKSLSFPELRSSSSSSLYQALEKHAQDCQIEKLNIGYYSSSELCRQIVRLPKLIYLKAYFFSCDDIDVKELCNAKNLKTAAFDWLTAEQIEEVLKIQSLHKIHVNITPTYHSLEKVFALIEREKHLRSVRVRHGHSMAHSPR